MEQVVLLRELQVLILLFQEQELQLLLLLVVEEEVHILLIQQV